MLNLPMAIGRTAGAAERTATRETAPVKVARSIL